MSGLLGNAEDWFSHDAAHSFIQVRKETDSFVGFVSNVGNICLT